MLIVEWHNSPFSLVKLKTILSVINKGLKLKSKKNISVALVTPKVIKKINHDYRGKNKVTDVLSFAFSNSETTGEILICLAQAKKQAKQFKHSLGDELQILLVHGILHIFGFNHLKIFEAKKMFTLQKKILKNLKIDWLGSEAG
jgi:probable rRNA maturation factor